MIDALKDGCSVATHCLRPSLTSSMEDGPGTVCPHVADRGSSHTDLQQQKCMKLQPNKLGVQNRRVVCEITTASFKDEQETSNLQCQRWRPRLGPGQAGTSEEPRGTGGCGNGVVDIAAAWDGPGTVCPHVADWGSSHTDLQQQKCMKLQPTKNADRLNALKKEGMEPDAGINEEKMKLLSKLKEAKALEERNQ